MTTHGPNEPGHSLASAALRSSVYFTSHRSFVGKSRSCTLVIAFALALSGCNRSETQVQARSHQSFSQFENPERDAMRAIRNRDFSLLGVNGFAVDVPGINADYEILREEYRIRLIAGTSDMAAGARGAAFNSAAKHYASKYNRFMFKVMGCNEITPMGKCASYRR
ncbi:MAG TPA: hypothetical protein VII49_06545 [Rhizomicrobium sp.]